MEHSTNKPDINIPELISKLDKLYDEEERLRLGMVQVMEDIELLEQMIMHASNKQARYGR